MANDRTEPALFFVKEGDAYHLVHSQRVFNLPDASSSDEQKDAYAQIAAIVTAGPQLVAAATTAGDWGHDPHAEAARPAASFHAEPPRPAASFHAEPPHPAAEGGES